MNNLTPLFRPIIAKPSATVQYVEIMPSEILKPYVRCFWGSPQPVLKIKQEDFTPHSTIIIPDACMDIIWEIDYHSNQLDCTFCGLNDAPFRIEAVNRTAITSTFAIRFNFWAVHLFADNTMRNSLNAFADISEYFRDFKSCLESLLIEKTTIEQRVNEAEKYLLRRLQTDWAINSNVMNAIYSILRSQGLISVSELCTETNLSQRQLQRLFLEFVGAPPKKIIDLVRFQNVWQDMYYSRKRDWSDIVYHYGYNDQPHFNNDFKKYSGRTPRDALTYSKS